MRYRLFIITAFVFMITAVINFNVRHYGDDFFYIRFTLGDLEYFLNRHIEHYFIANGRFIVHLLVTLFLGVDIRFWYFMNSLMLAGIVYFGARVATDMEKKDGLEVYAAVILGLTISLLDPNLTRQSIYWLTGSFNYVYPLFILLLYWYTLQRAMKEERIGWVVAGLAFLAAATVEQASLMAFGLTLLTLMEFKWIQKRGVEKTLLVSVLTALVGMLTVLFAPGVFHRASVEDAPTNNLVSLIQHNVTTQGGTFIFSETMAPYHWFAITSAMGVILTYRSQQRKWTETAIQIILCSACVGWLYIMSSDMNVMKNHKLILLYYFLILFVLVYAAFLVFKDRWMSNRTLPMIAVILGFGSQFMLFISPVYGPRNLLFAIVMLALYTASLMPKLNFRGISAICACGFCVLNHLFWLLPLPVIALFLILLGGRNKKLYYARTGIVLGYITIAFVSSNTIVPTIKGYSLNAKVYDQNLEIANSYRSEKAKGKLIQYKLPKENYAWVMPYHNPYYTRYYNLYLRLNLHTENEWKDHRL